MQTVTVKEIAAITGKAPRSIRRCAESGAWPFETVKGKGGVRKEFIIEKLPDDIRLLISATKTDPDFLPIPASTKAPALYTPSSKRPLSQAKIDKGMLKADLLRLYTQAIKRAGHGNKAKARKDFMRAYNSGVAYPDIFKAVGKKSWQTLEEWKRNVKQTGGTICLSDKRGLHRKGETLLTDEQQEILLACVFHPNILLISEAIETAKAIMAQRGIPNGFHQTTYRRWLETWRSTNDHIWAFHRGGEARWEAEHAIQAERDPNLIRVGDVLVGDGHVLNFEIKNPANGKPKRMVLLLWYDMRSNFPLGWEIMPTENTACINIALRRAIMRLGRIPKVVYLDNGRAFRARFFQNTDFEQCGFAGIYQQLGITPVFAWPYHGKSKTVERFFKTFAALERLCPTYSGTSIETKPPRMHRGEKVHRKVWDKVFGGYELTMEQAHLAIATWFDHYVQRPQRGKWLNGRAPMDLFMEQRVVDESLDPRELHLLMMATEIKRVRNSEIRLPGGKKYWHGKLQGIRHPLIVKWDHQDPRSIYVFNPDGTFLCDAVEKTLLHPSATHLGTDRHRQDLNDFCETKNRQKKESTIFARQFLENVVLPEYERVLEYQGINASIAAASQIGTATVKTVSLEAAKKALEEKSSVEDEAAAILRRLDERSEFDRYEKLLELQAQRVAIPEQYLAFMGYFERTDQYASDADYFDDLRNNLAIVYQDEMALQSQQAGS